MKAQIRVEMCIVLILARTLPKSVYLLYFHKLAGINRVRVSLPSQILGDSAVWGTRNLGNFFTS